MFSKILIMTLFAMISFSCTSKSKIIKEIDIVAPQKGHLYQLDNNIIEVVEIPGNRMKFFFYTMNKGELTPLSPKNIHLMNGIIDPSTTKQNYGIQFIERERYIEGIIELFKIRPDDEHFIIVDIVIAGKKRQIRIPFTHEK